MTAADVQILQACKMLLLLETIVKNVGETDFQGLHGLHGLRRCRGHRHHRPGGHGHHQHKLVPDQKHFLCKQNSSKYVYFFLCYLNKLC